MSCLLCKSSSVLSLLAMVKYLRLIQWKKRSTTKRRGRGRRKGVTPEIPLDLQIEILTRLPSKSLMRSKCISKRWYCLIRSRYFSNIYYLTVHASPQPRLYMSLVEHLHCDSMDVCHNPGKSLLLSLSLSSFGNTNSSVDESLDPYLTMQGIGGHNMMVLRSLLLYTVCRKACIYNPSTRQSVTLPSNPTSLLKNNLTRKLNVYYFLGHDPVLDQYKVVCNLMTFPEEDFGSDESITSEHWVFVLEAGSSWKQIDFDQSHVPSRLGLCINGVIYYLGLALNGFRIVIKFDVRSEEFNMIQAPQLEQSVGFVEYCGKPTIFDHTYLLKYGFVDLWVLGDGEKWSKKSIVLQPSHMHLVHDIIELRVECMICKRMICERFMSMEYRTRKGFVR